MWRSMFRVAAATALFGAAHSALASRPAKRAAARLFGQRNRNGLYRVFFIGQSLVSFTALAVYIRRQPGRELYQLRGPVVWVIRAGQGAALVYATAAASQVGITRILGLQSLLAWRGQGPVPPEPEAQGPALDAEGLSRPAGPFARSRHPLNFVPLPIFWLSPRMTTNLLAFNVLSTLYLIVGSLHEEARLRAAYPEIYVTYQTSGTPFYVPALFRSRCHTARRNHPAAESARRDVHPVRAGGRHL